MAAGLSNTQLFSSVQQTPLSNRPAPTDQNPEGNADAAVNTRTASSSSPPLSSATAAQSTPSSLRSAQTAQPNSTPSPARPDNGASESRSSRELVSSLSAVSELSSALDTLSNNAFRLDTARSGIAEARDALSEFRERLVAQRGVQDSPDNAPAVAASETIAIDGSETGVAFARDLNAVDGLDAVRQNANASESAEAGTETSITGEAGIAGSAIRSSTGAPDGFQTREGTIDASDSGTVDGDSSRTTSTVQPTASAPDSVSRIDAIPGVSAPTSSDGNSETAADSGTDLRLAGDDGNLQSGVDNATAGEERTTTAPFDIPTSTAQRTQVTTESLDVFAFGGGQSLATSTGVAGDANIEADVSALSETLDAFNETRGVSAAENANTLQSVTSASTTLASSLRTVLDDGRDFNGRDTGGDNRDVPANGAFSAAETIDTALGRIDQALEDLALEDTRVRDAQTVAETRAPPFTSLGDITVQSQARETVESVSAFQASPAAGPQTDPQDGIPELVASTRQLLSGVQDPIAGVLNTALRRF